MESQEIAFALAPRATVRDVGVRIGQVGTPEDPIVGLMVGCRSPFMATT